MKLTPNTTVYQIAKKTLNAEELHALIKTTEAKGSLHEALPEKEARTDPHKHIYIWRRRIFDVVWSP
jgi:hypothetical protein